MSTNGPTQGQGHDQGQGRGEGGPHSWQEKLGGFAQSCKAHLVDLEEKLRSEAADIVTPEARVHFRNSGREFLIGLREMIDQKLQAMPPGRKPVRLTLTRSAKLLQVASSTSGILIHLPACRRYS